MRKIFLIMLIVAFANTLSQAQPTPEIKRRVSDFSGTLSAGQISELEKKLEDHEKQTSNQIAIVIIDSLEGRVLETLSMEICEKWKGGQKGKDNGLLILIAKKEHKIRIEVGYGFEAKLPSGVCGRIIREEIAPSFKKDDYYGGLVNGINTIFRAVKGEYQADGKDSEEKSYGPMLVGMGLLIIFIISAALASGVNRPVGGIAASLLTFILFLFVTGFWWALLAGIIAFFIGLISADIVEGVSDGAGSSGGGGWSSGSSHSSGGGGWSGGGGSFGGGGASGGW